MPVQIKVDKSRNFHHNIDAFWYITGYFTAFGAQNKVKEEVGMNGIKGLKKYIISAKGTTVIFWNDGDKTTVRPGEGITPDPILGFLYNYYKNNFGLTKTQYKKILSTVKDDQVKEFLIEQFKIKNSQTDPSKLVKFLNNLKVEPYDKVVKIKDPMDDVEVLDFN
jgi:hypothetical protein